MASENILQRLSIVAKTKATLRQEFDNHIMELRHIKIEEALRKLPHLAWITTYKGLRTFYLLMLEDDEVIIGYDTDQARGHQKEYLVYTDHEKLWDSILDLGLEPYLVYYKIAGGFAPEYEHRLAVRIPLDHKRT